MFRLAHLSDPHLHAPGGPAVAELIGKRAIGHINWLRGRQAIHRADIAKALVADLRAQRADHIAMTGDLVNISAAFEWPAAHAYMRSLGTPEQVTAVPGNHDAYVSAGLEGMRGVYAPYVASEHQHGESAPTYPFARRRGPVTLIGVSTALPTPPFIASGRLGEAQLARLAALLAEIGATRTCKVLLIHHPPTQLLAAGRRGLDDADALGEVLARQPVDLILHGHNHTATLATMPGRDGPIPIVGVPSASAIPHGRKPGAGYAVIEVGGETKARKMTLVRRGISDDHAPGGPIAFDELSRQVLTD